jgi:hypothetical protein
MTSNEFAYWFRGFAGKMPMPTKNDWDTIITMAFTKWDEPSSALSPWSDPVKMKIYADQFMKGGSSP